MHAEHLEAAKGVGPHTISVPRIRAADDINPEDFTDAISDDIFAKIVAVLRIAVPYTGIIISTRESQKTRACTPSGRSVCSRITSTGFPSAGASS